MPEDTAQEVWIRSTRWVHLQPQPGPWHLRDASAARWSKRAVCGVYPAHSHLAIDQRPTEGKFCRKCLAAAKQHQAGRP